MTHPIHHMHIRKRMHQNLEQYPHPNKMKRMLDKSIYAIGVVGPIMTIPQIINVWIEKETSGISLLSWSTYTILALIWLFYGYVHKEKPIIIAHIFSFLVNFAVVFGAFLYAVE